MPEALPIQPLPAALAILILSAGAASAVAHARRRALAAILKMGAASGYLALAAAVGAAGSSYGRMLLAALALCWLGDLLLVARGRGVAFVAGLASFLLGHVAYAGAFLTAGVAAPRAAAAALPLAVVAAAILRWLWRAGLPGAMRGPVVAYVVAICAMVALAWGTLGAGGTALVPAGAVAFMASDVFVARERFVAPTPWNTRLGLPLYFLGQVLLALSA